VLTCYIECIITSSLSLNLERGLCYNVYHKTYDIT